MLLAMKIFTSSGNAQDYLWPTDASQYLTSSFAEYRPGHFHAGIDIKTWGQVGYRVFAVRDGYIMRIMASPFGYGKVIYQKLDTGETVVYAHLDRFNDELNTFLKQEQKRRKAYRVNKILGPSQFPVKQGDLIGYTGSTGIGSPHLHFEMRDRNNRPINPFLLGYKIVDTIPPKVSALSITPSDVYSRVNSDVIPFIEKPVQDAKGNYRLSAVPLVSGKIGFAIDCFDRADGVENTFAVYKLDFYVDGDLQFSATYNKFSYDESHLIDWDRDFRLMSRGKGIFQKLYKEKYNDLTFYKPSGDEIGILNCDPVFIPGSQEQDRLTAGEHQFSVELYDFFGNVTTVEGKFIVGEQKMLSANYSYEAPNQLYISGIRDETEQPVSNPNIFVSTNYGRIWRQMMLKPGQSNLDDQAAQIDRYLLQPIQPFTIIKIQSTGDPGDFSFPTFHFFTLDSLVKDTITELRIEKDFYDDYFRVKLTADEIIQNSPEVIVQQIGMAPISVMLWQKEFNEFIGSYQLIAGKDGPLSIEIKANNLAGRELAYWDQFDLQTITAHQGGMIASKDGKCQVSFGGEAVYKNVFLRLESLEPLADSKYDAIGGVYEIFPQDVPFKKSGRLELQYPVEDNQPEKLGIYRQSRRGWGFVGNKIDKKNRTISSQVSNLGVFTLIRDTIPPVLKIRYPLDNSIIRDNSPRLLAIVYDELSGIENERSIVMKLDGQTVIAEYDPEAKTIKFIPDEPISPGEHFVTVWASDNCNNEISVSSKFVMAK